MRALLGDVRYGIRFFTIADINLTVGRPFDAAVDRVSPQFVAVLSHRMWTRRLASDPLVARTLIRHAEFAML